MKFMTLSVYSLTAEKKYSGVWEIVLSAQQPLKDTPDYNSRVPTQILAVSD